MLDGGGPVSHTPAHESAATAAPFRAWRGSLPIIARGPTGHHNMAGRTLAPPWPSGRRRGPGAATSASIVHQTEASIKGARRKALQDGRHCLSNPGIPVGRRLEGGHATLGGAVPDELATAGKIGRASRRERREMRVGGRFIGENEQ